MERLHCPACNRSLQHRGDMAGQQLKCPACGEVFEAPCLNDRAIADCTEAIRLDPTLALAYCNRAVAYAKKGENDQAIADCTEAIEHDP